MRYFDEEQIREHLRWDALVPAMEAALAAFSMGRVVQPVRTVLTIEEDRRYLGIMPAVLDDVMGLKAVAFYPANAGSGVPTHLATIVLFRTSTGEPLATMDGRLITEMRTAAVSAAVTKYLMPPSSGVLAILGSGVQAHAHVEALESIHRFDEIRVWSPTHANAQRFAREHRARVMNDAESAVRGADVIVTATNATEPVLEGVWLKPGSHVNAVGACRPTWRELDDEAMANTVVVDSREAANRESGDVIGSKASIYGEAGEIFAGRLPVPEQSATTIFKSLGLAVEDIAAAKLILQRERP